MNALTALTGSTSHAQSAANIDLALRLGPRTASAGKCAALPGHGDDGFASLTVIASRCARSGQRSGRPPVTDAATDTETSTSLTTGDEPAM